MKVLDCESFDSALLSLETITGIEKGEIVKFLSDFDMDEYYDSHPDYDNTGDVLLFGLFKSTFNPSLDYDKTMWFHLTRTYPSTKFQKDGILPLGLVIDSIWDNLYGLVSDLISKDEWGKFRESLEAGDGGWPAHLYKMKTSDKFHHGPYAMLIRDAAFKFDEIGNHNFLDVPEIVEDICIPYKNRYGHDLLKLYYASTEPCIVKFVSDDVDPRDISPVLYYLYNMIHNKELSLLSNTTYDAKGPVLPENVKNVEFPTDDYNGCKYI